MIVFDADYYLAKNPDVAAQGIDPLAHFRAFGWREGRDPHPEFDVSFYIQQYPDVVAAKMNPLDHYLQFGAAEGRFANPAAAAAAAPATAAGIAAPLPAIAFDSLYYFAQNPDVAFARADAFVHFVLFGFREGRDPSPDFDVSWYLAVNRDVATSGINPLVHYNDFGRFEGRAPSPEPIGVRALVVKDITVNEQDGRASFIVTRTGGSLGGLTLDYKTTPKTALDGVDYFGVSGSLTFKPGESTKTIDITLVRDQAPEADETFGFEISNVRGTFFDAGASRLKATATLTERTIPLISVGDATVSEDGRIVAVTIARARDTSGTTVVEFATKDGTAIAGSDYIAVASTLTLPPGATTATVLVPIRLDDLPEEAETFTLVLRNVEGGKIGDDTGLVTIRNVATGIVDDFAADRSTTGRLALGAESKGGIQSTQDADWFQTALVGGKTYEIELGTAATGGGTLQGGRIALFDASGGFQGLSSLSGPSGEPLLTVTPEAGGTFFVEARGSGGLGSYALRLREMTDDYAGDATTTGVLAVGASKTGTIERPLDDDWFRVFLSAGRKYQFDLSGADSNGGTLPNPRLMMFNEAGAPTGQFSLGGGPGGDPRLVFTPQNSGTYFVEVTDTLTKIGTYTIALQDLLLV